MTTEHSFEEMKLTPHVVIEQMRRKGSTLADWGAVGGLGLGLVSPVIGALLTVIAWFTGSEWHGLHPHRMGTVLLVLTIPLLIFGAHCLDLADRSEREARRRRAK